MRRPGGRAERMASMTQYAFAKYEGLGNDFIVVDRSAAWVQRLKQPGMARELCDRHFGIGADGVLVVDAEVPSMHVINADGSEPEMCGNGLRCAAWHLVRTGRLALGERVRFTTGAGAHAVVVHGEGDVEIWMRAPTFVSAEIPVSSDAPMVDLPLHVPGRAEPLRVTAVGMGNPHAVTFDLPSSEADADRAAEEGDRDRNRDERLRIGPLVQQHERFAEHGVNVGFARIQGSRMDLFVLERGAGWTMACGTGACAAVAAAVKTGRCAPGETIFVRLPGGELSIIVDGPSAPARMRGPARHVFDGVLQAP